MAALGLPVIPPTRPDFHSCNRVYGSMLRDGDCYLASTNLPHGQNPVTYRLRQSNVPNALELPFSVSYGTCHISVEHAGPVFAAPFSIQIVPDEIRGMAGHVINECVRLSGGIGGFVTKGLTHLLEYIRISGSWIGPPNQLLTVPNIPPNVWFLTVTVSGPDERRYKPGDTDPDIPMLLQDRFDDLADPYVQAQDFRHPLFQHYYKASCRLGKKSEDMVKGGAEKWWEYNRDHPIEMTYECDAKLGSPSVVDCTQIQWQGLGPPSDTIRLTPGENKLISTKSCNLAISATAALTLTWAQIRTALETLIGACVQHPLKAPQGGRAYFGSQQCHAPGGRGKRDNKLKGGNALPPHVNLTIFAHDGSSTVDCEWQAVQKGKPVSSCRTK